MPKINRRLYRREMVYAKAFIYTGVRVEGDDFSPLMKSLYRLLRHQIGHPDHLQMRLSSFTPDAKSRTLLYPLAHKRCAAVT